MMDEKFYSHEIAKWKEYFNVMLQWVFLSQKGVDIGRYLEKNGYYKIAVYGMADIGNCLAGQIIKSGHCKLLYGIDQGFPKLYYDIPCYKLEHIAELEQPDVVIVTLPHIYEEIKEDIEQTVRWETMSVTELIYDAYYDVERR